MTRFAVIGAVATALVVAGTPAAFAAPGKQGNDGQAVNLKKRPVNKVQNRTDTSGAQTKATTSTDKFRAGGRVRVADSYIVVLKDKKATKDQVTADAGALTKAHNGKVGLVFAKSVRGFSATMSEADARKLSADPSVAYVEQNSVVTANDVQNTYPTVNPESNLNLWGLDRIDQPFLPVNHTYSYPGNGSAASGVTVYVIDSGVYQADSEFAGNTGFQHSWSAAWTPEQVQTCGTPAPGADDFGHGTFVASEITGSKYGVAKHVPIESVKVLDCTGSGTAAQIVAGVEHVTDTAVKPAVANMSIGFKGGVSQAVDDAIQASIASGITYVLAAGNEGVDACLRSPSRVTAAITVGATDRTDFRASFSNYGSCLDIYAPGENIEGIWGTQGPSFAGGTSMAAPMVAGDAVLLLKAHPTWTPAQVRDAIVGAGISGTVHAAGAGSTTKLLRTGEPAAPTSFGLRAHANNLIVTAEGAGARPEIANRYTVGAWEGLTIVDAGDGAHVGLRSSSNNLYVSAETAGAAPLIANRPTIGAWEKFTLIKNADGSVSLQAAVNGKYVTADNGGNSPLIANRTSIGIWEEFDLAGPAANVYMVANANYAAVTADNGGKSPLIANRGSVGAWEQFDVVDAGGYAGFLAHADTLLVTADSGGAKPLIANRSAAGAWEKFTIVNNDDGSVGYLANANNRYVTADNGGNSPLIANRTSIGIWEEFWVYTYDELTP